MIRHCGVLQSAAVGLALSLFGAAAPTPPFVTFAAFGAAAQAADIEVEVSSRFSLESRWYPETALHPGQRSHASGFTAEPEFYAEDEEGRSLTVSPFIRYDSADSHRSHVDLREAFLLLYGEAGEGEWELRLGVDRVSWGVAEVRNLVDIVNQTDLIEHPDEKTKLGQFMAHGTWSADWGSLELFLLPWHRERIYPGRAGRLRSGLVVDDDKTTYDSAAEERHMDWALRYTGSFGPVDLGLSYFDGQNREPSLRPAEFLEVPGLPFPVPTALHPHYEKIRQFGLDAQLTTGPWLFKLEAIRRLGASNRFVEEDDYGAWIVGGEHTLYSVFDTDAEISLLAEWYRDGRGPERATNAFENDLFLAARLALNDVEGTEFIVSVIEDLDHAGRAFGFEAKRRLDDNWSVKLEGTAFHGVDWQADALYDVRRDSFIAVSFVYNL